MGQALKAEGERLVWRTHIARNATCAPRAERRRQEVEIGVSQFAAPLEQAHRDEQKSIGKKRAIPQRRPTRR
jgi:hypothetical protein